MGIHATREQFFSAIKALSEEEQLALIAVANHHAGGRSGFASGHDLFNEAVLRVADGARHWPIGVPVAVFLRNAMRSIANGERGLLHMSPIRWKSLSREEIDADASLAIYAGPSAEEEAIANERLRLGQAALDVARRMLGTDDEGIGVLDCMVGGYTAAETRDELGLTDARYRAARARVRMRLDNWVKEHGS